MKIPTLVQRDCMGYIKISIRCQICIHEALPFFYRFDRHSTFHIPLDFWKYFERLTKRSRTRRKRLADDEKARFLHENVLSP